MRCLYCHSEFISPVEEQRASILYEIPFCSWECFRDSEYGLRMHLSILTKRERERFLSGKGLKDEGKAKEKCRGYYHVGAVGAKPGSAEAKAEEDRYREKMRESCKRRPPRVGHSGFGSDSNVNPPLLPSEAIMGVARSRILDEADIKMGGEDGEKFDFTGE